MGLSQLPSSKDDESEAAILSEINLTPLIDVFLVLLIIFMVTSSVMSQTGVQVDLPKASQGLSESQSEGIVVTLLPNLEMEINGTRIPKDNWNVFDEKLKEAFTKTTSRLVVLEGDREAYLGVAIDLMDHARRVGAASFAIATQPRK